MTTRRRLPNERSLTYFDQAGSRDVIEDLEVPDRDVFSQYRAEHDYELAVDRPPPGYARSER